MAPFSVSALSFLENVNVLRFLPIQPVLFHENVGPSSGQL